MPLLRLPAPFPSRDGTPILRRADSAIFTRRYFAACMSCDFCDDACCAHGVDVEEPAVARILRHADALEPLVGVSRDRWFSDELVEDAEFPGGRHRRTSVIDGGCVFRNRAGRGCALHSYSLDAGIDYHVLKPMVSSLFPLSFSAGVLCLADDLADGPDQVICAGNGQTVYRALRDELVWYFGSECVAALDVLEMRTAGPRPVRSRRSALPVLT